MNKKYLSVILFGALMLGTTGTFTSCKDYDDDINNLQEQVDGIKSDLKALQDKVNNGLWVTSVSPVEGGFTITFSDGQSYQIVNGKDGESADPGTIVSVSEDGYWVIGDTKTPYKALTDEDVNALKKNPYVNADGYWVFIVDGEEEVSNIKAEPVTAVFSDGVWTLSVYNAETKEYDKIEIPTAASLITELDLMGWANVAKASANFSLDMGGTADVNDDTKNKNVLFDANTLLSFEYYRVTKFDLKEWDGNAWKVTKENFVNSWSAQKDVVKKQVLTTLAPLNKKLVARLAPAELGWSDFAFTLQDSKGNQLPIALGAGEALTGTLTKAGASSSIGFIPMDVVTTTYNTDAEYTGKFNANTLYSLVEKTSNYRSTYGLTVDVPKLATVDVQSVVNVDPVGKVGTTTDNGSGTEDKPFVIDLNTPARLVFGDKPEYVYDYYVEAVDTKVAQEFDCTIDKKNGTITFGQASDPVSKAAMEFKVYALHIDGNIYVSYIWVKPSSILATDVVLKAGKQTIAPILNAKGEIIEEGKMMFNVSLADMFSGMSETEKDRWTSIVMGANGGATSTAVKDSKGNAYTQPVEIKYVGADGKEIDNTANDKAVSLNIYMPYRKTVGANFVAALTPDLEYTMNVQFNHNEDGGTTSVLNTVKVTFTPVLPDLSNFLAKKTGYWDGNTLMAYFDDPTTAQVGDAFLASVFDIRKGFGTFGATDKTKPTAKPIATIKLSLDETQKIGNDYVVANNLATFGTPNEDYEIELKGGNNNKKAYNQALNVLVGIDYLGVYDYTENATYKQQLTDANFQIKVQSALIAGTIKALEGTSIQMTPAAAGDVWKLTADHVSGYTYSYSNGNQTPYNIFQEWLLKDIEGGKKKYGAKWKYTYIKAVTFSSADPDIYVVTNELGNPVTDNIATAIAPTGKEDGTPLVESYVPLKSVNTTEKVETTLKITVTDMYGYKKTFDVPLTINPAK